MGEKAATTGARQCKAHSKRSGKRCLRAPIPGGSVCYMHGGAAPQVQRSARERLAALVEPAILRLAQLLRDKRDKKVALGAVKDVLDRNGFKAPDRFEHSGPDGAPIEGKVTFYLPDNGRRETT